MEEACASGNLDLVKESFQALLLDPDSRLRLSERAMPGSLDVIQRSTCIAARRQHPTIFSFLLGQGAAIDATVAGAVFEGDDIGLCQAMLDHGWEPRAGTVPNRSILASETCLRWVLQHGWDPNLYGHDDAHPLTIAAASFPRSTVAILLDHGVSIQGTMAMHAAAFAAALDPTRFGVLDLLLDRGGDVNEMEVDPKGRRPPRQRTGFTGTPLHHAIAADSIETVKYLLGKGASRTAPSWSGRNALEVAESGGKTKIAEVIRSWT